eukprot:GHVH01012035.1.p1 GENE.GHVH01012035.1~~GHVH01012035.1.p1  ORF type:complete len:4588 (+),score=644.10 GHVH01012035.1:162-13925(+)
MENPIIDEVSHLWENVKVLSPSESEKQDSGKLLNSAPDDSALPESFGMDYMNEIPIHFVASRSHPTVAVIFVLIYIVNMIAVIHGIYIGVLDEQITLDYGADVMIWNSSCSTKFTKSHDGVNRVHLRAMLGTSVLFSEGTVEGVVSPHVETFDDYFQNCSDFQNIGFWELPLTNLPDQMTNLFEWLKSVRCHVSNASWYILLHIRGISNELPNIIFDTRITEKLFLSPTQTHFYEPATDKRPAQFVASLRRISDVDYVLCQLEFQLTPSYRFNELSIVYEDVSGLQNITADVDISASKGIHVMTRNANVNFKSLASPKIQISIVDGILVFELHGERSDYDFDAALSTRVKSLYAPVYVTAGIPLYIKMEEKIASFSFLKAPALDVKHLSDASVKAYLFDLETKESSKMLSYLSVTRGMSLSDREFLGLTIETQGAPIYGTFSLKTQTFDELEAWAGVKHLEDVSLTRFSQSKIKDLDFWLKQIASGSAWIATIHVTGKDLPKGFWKVVSSSAYLGGHTWFVLFSSFLLRPISAVKYLHMYGMFCREETNQLGHLVPEALRPQSETAFYLRQTEASAENADGHVIDALMNSVASDGDEDDGVQKTTAAPSPHVVRKLTDDDSANEDSADESTSSNASDILLSNNAQMKKYISSDERLQMIYDEIYPGGYIGLTPHLSFCPENLIKRQFLVLNRSFVGISDSSTSNVFVQRINKKRLINEIFQFFRGYFGWKTITYDSETVEETLFNLTPQRSIKFHKVSISDQYSYLISVVVTVMVGLLLSYFIIRNYWQWVEDETMIDRDVRARKIQLSHRLSNASNSKRMDDEDDDDGRWMISVTPVCHPVRGHTIRWVDSPEIRTQLGYKQITGEVCNLRLGIRVYQAVDYSDNVFGGNAEAEGIAGFTRVQADVAAVGLDEAGIQKLKNDFYRYEKITIIFYELATLSETRQHGIDMLQLFVPMEHDGKAKDYIVCSSSWSFPEHALLRFQLDAVCKEDHEMLRSTGWSEKVLQSPFRSYFDSVRKFETEDEDQADKNLTSFMTMNCRRTNAVEWVCFNSIAIEICQIPHTFALDESSLEEDIKIDLLLQQMERISRCMECGTTLDEAIEELIHTEKNQLADMIKTLRKESSDGLWSGMYVPDIFSALDLDLEFYWGDDPEECRMARLDHWRIIYDTIAVNLVHDPPRHIIKEDNEIKSELLKNPDNQLVTYSPKLVFNTDLMKAMEDGMGYEDMMERGFEVNDVYLDGPESIDVDHMQYNRLIVNHVYLQSHAHTKTDALHDYRDVDKGELSTLAKKEFHNYAMAKAYEGIIQRSKKVNALDIPSTMEILQRLRAAENDEGPFCNACMAGCRGTAKKQKKKTAEETANDRRDKANSTAVKGGIRWRKNPDNTLSIFFQPTSVMPVALVRDRIGASKVNVALRCRSKGITYARWNFHYEEAIAASAVQYRPENHWHVVNKKDKKISHCGCCYAGYCLRPRWENTYHPPGNSNWTFKLSFNLRFDCRRPFLRHFRFSGAQLHSSVETHLKVRQPLTYSFKRDEPGKIITVGTTELFEWEVLCKRDEDTSIPAMVWFHVVRHDMTLMEPVNGGRGIPNSGSLSWVVELDLVDIKLISISLMMTDGPIPQSWYGEKHLIPSQSLIDLPGGLPPGVRCLAMTHIMNVCRRITIQEFELAFATFCRCYHLEMCSVNKEKLQSLGFHCRKLPIKSISNTRMAMPGVENLTCTPMLVHPGQYYTVASSMVLSVNRPSVSEYDLPDAMANSSVMKAEIRDTWVIEDINIDMSGFFWRAGSFAALSKKQYNCFDLVMNIGDSLGMTDITTKRRVWSAFQNPNFVLFWNQIMPLLKKRQNIDRPPQLKYRLLSKYLSIDMQSLIFLNRGESVNFKLPCFTLNIREAIMINTELSFFMQRFSLFELVPVFVTHWVAVVGIITRLLPSIGGIFMMLAWNQTDMGLRYTTHTQVSPSFVLDVLYTNHFMTFIFCIEEPFRSYFFILCYCQVVHLLGLVIHMAELWGPQWPFAKQAKAWLRHGQTLCHFWEWLTVLVLGMWLLWTGSALLIHAGQTLSILIMMMGVMFVVYKAVDNHASNRTLVQNYITAKQPVLLTLALDNWFSAPENRSADPEAARSYGEFLFWLKMNRIDHIGLKFQQVSDRLHSEISLYRSHLVHLVMTQLSGKPSMSHLSPNTRGDGHLASLPFPLEQGNGIDEVIPGGLRDLVPANESVNGSDWVSIAAAMLVNDVLCPIELLKPLTRSLAQELQKIFTETAEENQVPHILNAFVTSEFLHSSAQEITAKSFQLPAQKLLVRRLSAMSPYDKLWNWYARGVIDQEPLTLGDALPTVVERSCPTSSSSSSHSTLDPGPQGGHTVYPKTPTALKKNTLSFSMLRRRNTFNAVLHEIGVSDPQEDLIVSDGTSSKPMKILVGEGSEVKEMETLVTPTKTKSYYDDPIITAYQDSILNSVLDAIEVRAKLIRSHVHFSQTSSSSPTYLGVSIGPVQQNVAWRLRRLPFVPVHDLDAGTKGFTWNANGTTSDELWRAVHDQESGRSLLRPYVRLIRHNEAEVFKYDLEKILRPGDVALIQDGFVCNDGRKVLQGSLVDNSEDDEVSLITVNGSDVHLNYVIIAEPYFPEVFELRHRDMIEMLFDLFDCDGDGVLNAIESKTWAGILAKSSFFCNSQDFEAVSDQREQSPSIGYVPWSFIKGRLQRVVPTLNQNQDFISYSMFSLFYEGLGNAGLEQTLISDYISSFMPCRSMNLFDNETNVLYTYEIQPNQSRFHRNKSFKLGSIILSDAIIGDKRSRSDYEDDEEEQATEHVHQNVNVLKLRRIFENLTCSSELEGATSSTLVPDFVKAIVTVQHQLMVPLFGIDNVLRIDALHRRPDVFQRLVCDDDLSTELRVANLPWVGARELHQDLRNVRKQWTRMAWSAHGKRMQLSRRGSFKKIEMPRKSRRQSVRSGNSNQLSVFGINEDSDSYSDDHGSVDYDADPIPAPPLTGKMVQALKLLQVDLQEQIDMACRDEFGDCFNYTTIRTNIAEFFDVIMIKLIEKKTMVVLAPTLNTSISEYHPYHQVIYREATSRVDRLSSNLDECPILTKEPFYRKLTITGSIAIEKLTYIKDRFLYTLRDMKIDYSKVPASMERQANMDICYRFLVSAGILKAWQFYLSPCSFAWWDDVLWVAKSSHLDVVMSSFVDEARRTGGNLWTDEGACALTGVVAGQRTYIWFEVVLWIIELMGVDLRADYLPGAATQQDLRPEKISNIGLSELNWRQALDELRLYRGLEEGYHAAKIGQVVWDDTPDAEKVKMVKRGDTIEHANVTRLLDIYWELSHFSGVLSSDLIDETIMLALDDHIPFASGVVCLKYLDILNDELSLVGLTPYQGLEACGVRRCTIDDTFSGDASDVSKGENRIFRSDEESGTPLTSPIGSQGSFLFQLDSIDLLNFENVKSIMPQLKQDFDRLSSSGMTFGYLTMGQVFQWVEAFRDTLFVGEIRPWFAMPRAYTKARLRGQVDSAHDIETDRVQYVDAADRKKSEFHQDNLDDCFLHEPSSRRPPWSSDGSVIDILSVFQWIDEDVTSAGRPVGHSKSTLLPDDCLEFWRHRGVTVNRFDPKLKFLSMFLSWSFLPDKMTNHCSCDKRKKTDPHDKRCPRRDRRLNYEQSKSTSLPSDKTDTDILLDVIHHHDVSLRVSREGFVPKTYRGQKRNVDHKIGKEPPSVVSLNLFHKILLRLGMSDSMQASTVYWILIASEITYPLYARWNSIARYVVLSTREKDYIKKMDVDGVIPEDVSEHPTEKTWNQYLMDISYWSHLFNEETMKRVKSILFNEGEWSDSLATSLLWGSILLHTACSEASDLPSFGPTGDEVYTPNMKDWGVHYSSLLAKGKWHGFQVTDLSPTSIPLYLPWPECSESLVRLLMLPQDKQGNPISNYTLNLEKITNQSLIKESRFSWCISPPPSEIIHYQGSMNFKMFTLFLKINSIDIHPEGVKNMWMQMKKDALDVSAFIPHGFSSMLTRRSNIQNAWRSGTTPGSNQLTSGEYNRLTTDNSIEGQLSHAVAPLFAHLWGVDYSMCASADQSIHRLAVVRKFDPQDHFRPENLDSVNTIICLNRRRSKSLRIGMDVMGMNICEGSFSSIDTMMSALPQILLGGLWPNAIKLIYSHINRHCSSAVEANIQILYRRAVVSSLFERSRSKSTVGTYVNSNGLVRVDYMLRMFWELRTMSGSGLEFGHLRSLIHDMQMDMNDSDIKRLFDQLDLNKDGTLDMTELLGGFEQLIEDNLPAKIIHQIGLTDVSLFRTLGKLFAFAGLTASFILLAFDALHVDVASTEGGFGDSLLAIMGAGILERGNSQSAKSIGTLMRLKVARAFGIVQGTTPTRSGADPESNIHVRDFEKRVEAAGELIRYINQVISSRQGSVHNDRKEKDTISTASPIQVSYDTSGCVFEHSSPDPCIDLQMKTSVYLSPTVRFADGRTLMPRPQRVVKIKKTTIGADADDSDDFAVFQTTVKRSDKERAAPETNLEDLVFQLLPALPKDIGLTFDPSTGVIEGEVASCGFDLNRGMLAMRGSRNSAHEFKLRQSFVVIARNRYGSCCCRLSMTLPREFSGDN